ncbi:chemotaxis protein CheB [Duganella sp. P38]|jgi:two-component system chemotaxis response regulator CheB|uniref:chemotaxis protein CheB n=1 Tax=Duganella sp. P38 TaxID=3423949 RepID=UPI003D78FD00
MDKLVVIGASAGGIDALATICADLPVDFPAPVLIVTHVGPEGNALHEVLAQRCVLPVRYGEHGQLAKPSEIVIAAPGRHLTVVREGVNAGLRLVDEPHPYLRPPAINPLFHSAAEAFGKDVIGVLLSGFLDDGVEGLRHIQARGGVIIVQDPSDAQVPDMPANAIRGTTPNSILRSDSIAPALIALAGARHEAPACDAALQT